MKNIVVHVVAAVLFVFSADCAVRDSFDGRDTGDPTDPGAAIDGPDTVDPVDPGEMVLRSLQSTGDESTADASCAQCHGADGSGGRAASIRGVDATLLQEHAQGDASHPAISGGRPGRVPEIKFPELDRADFEALATFLADN